MLFVWAGVERERARENGDDPGDDGVQLLPVTKFLSTPDLEGDTLLSGQ